ncbi:MAG: hypothetical protein WA053_01730 [Minisyncoccia bacterium]
MTELRRVLSARINQLETAMETSFSRGSLFRISFFFVLFGSIAIGVYTGSIAAGIGTFCLGAAIVAAAEGIAAEY